VDLNDQFFTNSFTSPEAVTSQHRKPAGMKLWCKVVVAVADVERMPEHKVQAVALRVHVSRHDFTSRRQRHTPIW
jgi:hypothetical protein